MTVALSARRAALTPPWVKLPLWKAAREVPSWHIAPARTGNIVDLVAGQSLVTFTNSSPAWGFNSSGVLVQPTANVPFIEYDPATGACLGWRIWDAVTNSIRNSIMVDAVAGTPGTLPTNWGAGLVGLARQVVGVGTANGIDYIDIRFSGTPTSTGSIEIKPDGNASIAATASQSWAISSWVAVVGGSTANISSSRLALNEYSAGPTYLRTTTYASSILSAGSTLTRVSGVNTTGASTTIVQPLFLFGVTSGLAVDITIRIGLPQLQQSATVGPVVKTSGLTASSTADVASITGAAFAGIWNQAAGTMFADFRLNAITSQNKVLNADAGSGFANSVDLYCASGYPRFGVLETGIAQVALSLLPLAPLGVNVDSRIAGAYKLDDFAATRSQGTVVTDTLGIIPTVTRLGIGSLNGGNFLNGYIRELAIFKSRRPNDNLQSMTQ